MGLASFGAAQYNLFVFGWAIQFVFAMVKLVLV